ncbi:MAG: hypothetical protein GW808_05655 [Sphingomonadales bacterium]|nr:hypothetical protein [Sphingomonadales bacterium]NCO49570.1 hypothetical protein [Sphingomonadales bacterium]NCO98815.1 hypothetical protein [Sphingomonadales bacterium]NCP25798.1 hypothetical protein [Sphingomonadales bacterium]NCP42853.1 hypothetical protein [Sphingomonadales bacterium]
MNTEYEIQKITWDGIEIEVRWASNWMDFDDGTSVGHLEIQSVSPQKHPLPMTETGYRSHFIHADEINQFGGALNYIESWLAAESKSNKWLERKAVFSQLALL